MFNSTQQRIIKALSSADVLGIDSIDCYDFDVKTYNDTGTKCINSIAVQVNDYRVDLYLSVKDILMAKIHDSKIVVCVNGINFVIVPKTLTDVDLD